MNTVWCLFVIENQYYQPDNNLVAIFRNYPQKAQLKKRFDNRKARELHKDGYINLDGAEYRLEEVTIGEWLE